MEHQSMDEDVEYQFNIIPSKTMVICRECTTRNDATFLRTPSEALVCEHNIIEEDKIDGPIVWISYKEYCEKIGVEADLVLPIKVKSEMVEDSGLHLSQEQSQREDDQEVDEADRPVDAQDNTRQTEDAVESTLVQIMSSSEAAQQTIDTATSGAWNQNWNGDQPMSEQSLCPSMEVSSVETISDDGNNDAEPGSCN
uniref:Uncharacterized protein n=1 Tax=Anopheles albimanus TaxID=7167 RepID=A0A182F2I8_ANOAL